PGAGRPEGRGTVDEEDVAVGEVGCGIRRRQRERALDDDRDRRRTRRERRIAGDEQQLEVDVATGI
ncbi:MAG: hypothetical protein J0J00_00045, partial [Microbacterium sp.]|nr:hypothetical protein [Microbacterium sp.]